MVISYKKLRRLLIDRNLKKRIFNKRQEVSTASITKMGRNENINAKIIEKICPAFDCNVADIMEITGSKD